MIFLISIVVGAETTVGLPHAVQISIVKQREGDYKRNRPGSDIKIF